MSQNRVVMKDIAEKAGVHQTTVSMALRNDPRIKKETKEKIQKIAKEMGYTPDPLLTSLVSYRRKSKITRYKETLALLFDVDIDKETTGGYFPEIRNAVINRASELGYKVEVFTKGVDFTSSQMLNRVLKTRSIHGIIFGTILHEDTQFELDWDYYSVIKISQTPLDLDVDSIMGNYAYSVRKALRKLKAMGFKRPAMTGSVLDEFNTRNAYAEGFLYGQWKHYEPENHIPYYEFTRKANVEINEEIYQWLKEVKPDVVLSYWNNIFEPAYRLTVEDHHSCQFITLTGDDGITSKLGGIQNNYKKMARTATELLIGKLQINARGLPDSPTVTLVDSKWKTPGEWPPANPEQFLDQDSVLLGKL